MEYNSAEAYKDAWEKAVKVEFDARLCRTAVSSHVDENKRGLYVLRVAPQWHEEIHRRLNPEQIQQIDSLFYARALGTFDGFSLRKKDLTTQTYKLPDGSMIFVAREKGFDPNSAKRLDTDDWYNPLREWAKVARGNMAAHDVIDELVEHVFSFSSLSEMNKSVRAMNPGGFIRDSGARAVLYGCMKWSEFQRNETPMPYGENQKEIKQIDQWLERRGVKQLRLLGAGSFSAAFDTNGEYVVRIDNKRERELQGELPPQMLKSVFEYETEHYRVRIMPRLKQNATREDFEDTKHALALQGYDFFDQKANKYNIGLLPDNTPIVYDLGAVRKDSGVTEFVEPSYEQKNTWTIDGKDKQAHFFPWVEDNEPNKEQRFRDYMKGYNVATQPFDEWFANMSGKNYIQKHNAEIFNAVELDGHGHAVSGTSIDPFEKKILEEIAADESFQQKPIPALTPSGGFWERFTKARFTGNNFGRA